MAQGEMYQFQECDVQTLTAVAHLPAGGYWVVEQGVMGASIRPPGRSLDVSLAEWNRLKASGTARKSS